MTRTIERTLLLAALFWSGCALWQAAKPIVRTLYDAAKVYCEASVGAAGAEQFAKAYPDLAALSPADACEQERVYRPFLDLLTASQGAAMRQAGLSRPADPPPASLPSADGGI
jgi:hypothetical protein